MAKTLRVAQFLTLGYTNFGWRGFNAHERNFTPGALDVDLTGRHVVVTGATAGLGRAAAVALADRSATVHLVARDTARAQALADELAANGATAVVHRCDLSSLASVDEFVRELDAAAVPVSVLINNAGAMMHHRERSPDGHEIGFATNTLGTYALTERLRPVLQRTAERTGRRARVVTVSSGGMLTERLEVDDLDGVRLHKPDDRIDGAAQYALCKRRQVALTEHWARKYAADNIFWASMHPGWASTPGLEKAMPDFYRLTKSQLRSDEQGADTIVYLAVADEVDKLESGQFFFDRAPARKHLWVAGTEYSKSQVDKLEAKLREMVTNAGYTLP